MSSNIVVPGVPHAIPAKKIEDFVQLAQEAAELADSEGNATIALEARNDAEEFAAIAESARDAAFVNADVYEDIETGRADVADGEQFAVVSGDEIIRYRRDSSTTHTEVARYPAASRVETLARLGASIASAATIDLAAADGDFVAITGTEAISSLGTASAGGVTRTVRAISTGLRFVHSSDLRLPGGVDITCGANDALTFRTSNIGGTTWVCTSYVRAQGFRQDIPEASLSDSGLLSGANLARLRGMAESEAALNANNPALLARVFQSTPEEPSDFLRIFVPIGNGLHARIDHKRGSMSVSEQDVGQVQESWEIDAISARRVYAADNASSVMAGSWSTGTAFTADGDWARISSNEGAARTADFTGTVFRFSWLEGEGTAPIRLIVDGAFFELIPAGSGTPRRRTITRAVPGDGAHTLRYEHAGTEGDPIYVIGVNVSDAGGFGGVRGPLPWGFDVAAGQEFLRAGVQALVMRKEGGLRMGGGHGGVVNAVDPQLIIDGVSIDPNDFPDPSPPNWLAARREIRLEQAFDYEHPVDTQDPTGSRYLFARAHLSLRYVHGGYDGELDVLIADSEGEALQEFFWAMLPLAAEMTNIRRPLSVALDGAAPLDPWSESVEYVDPITGAAVEMTSRATLTGTGDKDPKPLARLFESSAGLFKHYGYGAGFGDTESFAGRQRITWSVRFRPGSE